jgi:NAD(P) transhydrogenase subunit alpha
MGNTKSQTPNIPYISKTARHSADREGLRASVSPSGHSNLKSVRFGLGVFLLAVTSSLAQAPEAAATSHGEAKFDLTSALFVFMLATFIGLEVIRRVSRLLHTPLMSLTNAISAIAVVGAILVAGPEHPTFIHVLGLVAVVASVTNIVSGFLITDRMLKMFKKRPAPNPTEEGNKTAPQ